MLLTPSMKLGLQAQPLIAVFPTMSDIMESSKAQNLKLHLDTMGPFFRVRATSSSDECLKLGRAEGIIKPWIGGNILHLDSMRMTRATLRLDRSIFGLGLFVGAAAVRHGYDNGCRKAELLAINDTEIYHSKVTFLCSTQFMSASGTACKHNVLTFSSGEILHKDGIQTVKEVDGSSLGDLPHMLVWKGRELGWMPTSKISCRNGVEG